jgi:hypothetical protein
MSVKQDLLVQTILAPEQTRLFSLGQWDDLLRLARSANLLSRLAERLQVNGLFDQVPDQPRQHILSARILSEHQQQAIQWELNHIAEALEPLGITVILLKGAAYVHADLPAARGRLFGDVDILVPHGKLPQVEAALMLHGWLSDESDAYNQRYYREWMHEIPPMLNHSRGTVIDVHHTILPLTARPKLPAQLLFEEARTVRPGSPFQVLSPCDMVIHSATHLFYESELKNGLRDLFDLDSLLRHFATSEPDFWDRLTQRAEVLDLAGPVGHAFRYCSQLLETPIPPGALNNTRRKTPISVINTWLLDAAYKRALRPDHPLAADFWSPLARFALYIRGHALRMPLPMLVRHLTRKSLMRLVKSDSHSFE